MYMYVPYFIWYPFKTPYSRHVQSNLSNMDTEGTERSVHIRELSILEVTMMTSLLHVSFHRSIFDYTVLYLHLYLHFDIVLVLVLLNDKVSMSVYPPTGNGTYRKLSTPDPWSVHNKEITFV